MANIQTVPYLMANGQPKPEWTLKLKAPFSDGTTEITLSEPNIKAVRAASKHLELHTNEAGEKEPTPDSAFGYGVTLIASVTGIKEALIEELKVGDFAMAQGFLGSFQAQ